MDILTPKKAKIDTFIVQFSHFSLSRGLVNKISNKSKTNKKTITVKIIDLKFKNFSKHPEKTSGWQIQSHIPIGSKGNITIKMVNIFVNHPATFEINFSGLKEETISSQKVNIELRITIKKNWFDKHK